MSDPNYYLKKGEKSIGPLTFDRLVALQQQGKIQSDALVAESVKGPWVTMKELEAHLGPIAAEQVHSGGTFDLGGLLPPSAPASRAYWSPNHNTFRGGNENSEASRSVTVESEDANVLIRFFFPWIGENSKNRYGNLDRYIAIYKFANRVGFMVWTVALMLLLVCMVLGTIMTGGNAINNGEQERVPAIVGSLLGGIVLIAILFAILHLLYIAFMAIIDFLRLMIDVEANTRKSR